MMNAETSRRGAAGAEGEAAAPFQPYRCKMLGSLSSLAAQQSFKL